LRSQVPGLNTPPGEENLARSRLTLPRSVGTEVPLAITGVRGQRYRAGNGKGGANCIDSTDAGKPSRFSRLAPSVVAFDGVADLVFGGVVAVSVDQDPSPIREGHESRRPVDDAGGFAGEGEHRVGAPTETWTKPRPRSSG